MAGDATVPALVATIATAPLIVLLVSQRTLIERTGAMAHPGDALVPAPSLVGVLVALLLLLAGNLIVIGDLARLLGFARLHGLVAGVALTLVVVVSPAADRWWRLMTPIGVVILLALLGLVATSTGSPRVEWATLASRPAHTFDAHSPWVTEGRPFAEPTRLTFDEPHRVVAAAAATWRVVERDAARVSIREWRLRAGDALTLRPGDQLGLEAGARVRFEAGRRVPGAAASGVAWADGRPRRAWSTFAVSLGGVVTLVVGGLALAPPVALPISGAAGFAVATSLLAFVLGATAWGFYGISIAPDVALTPYAFAPLVETLTRIVGPAWRRALVDVLAVGVIVLFLGVVVAWRARLRELIRSVSTVIGRPEPSTLAIAAGTAGFVTLAAALAARVGDPWRLFTWGLGIAAATAVAPRLGATDARGELVGGMVGGLAFLAIVVLAAGLPLDAVVLAEHPALAAAPLAWAAARVSGRRGV